MKSDVIKKRRLLSIWGALAVTTFALFYLIWWLIEPDGYELTDCGIIDYVWDFAYCAIFNAISLAFSELIRKWILRKQPSVARMGLHAILLCVSNFAIVLVFENAFDAYWHVDDRLYWDRIFAFSIIASLLSCIHFCFDYCAIIIRQGKRNAEMQKELLKLQLDPHFVFNSLSTLTELISEDQKLAEDFTLKFSAIYRYIVNQLNKETVAIAEEMRFIRDYCALLEIRHPNHFVFDIDGQLEHDNRLILPMSVQILVENAVKHNSHSVRHPLHIRIWREGEWLVVENERIPLTGKSPSTNKIGLKNLCERYALQKLCPVIIEEEKLFEVKIPVIQR